MNINIVGKCGLYCGACSIFRAQRDNDKERRLIAKEFNCSVDQVRCNGCGSLSTECWCHGCKIIACLNSKNYEFCYQCSDFEDKSCEKHNKLAETYLKVGEDLRMNLSIFKEGKIKEWLIEQDEKYSCPKCNHKISAWDNQCPQCGSILK